MRLSWNLLAGLANSIWTALIGLAVIPMYLKYLGIEAYGLIGFFVTIQALLQLLDMGLAPTINREVARYSAIGNLAGAGKLLHTLGVVYWGMAVTIALLLVALAPLIANHWLQSRHLSPQVISNSIMLMGLVIACRWPIGLYQGALIGAERLAVSSSVSITMVTLGNFGAVVVLAFISPTIEAFFMWQAGVSLVYAFTMRWATWRVVGSSKQTGFDINQLKSIWRFSIGMSGLAFLGLLLNQLDKVILSKLLTLEAFAHYMLATVVASGLFVVVSPVFNTIYPRFTALVVAGDTGKLVDLYRIGTRTLATILFPVAMLLAISSNDLVLIWTGDPDIASQVAPIISILVMGTAIQGVMYFPYALQLAYGMTRLPLMISTIMVIVMVPLIVVFAEAYQAKGGAMSWLVVNVLYLLLGAQLTHRHLLKGIEKKWLAQDVGIPLMLSVIAGLVGHYGIQGMECSVYLKLIYGGVLALIAFMFSVLLSSQLRLLVIRSCGWKTSGFKN